MPIRSAAVDAGDFAKPGHQFVGTTHGAGEGPADAEVKLPGSLLPEAGVEGDDLDDLDGRDVEFISDPVDGFGADETEVMLDFVKKGEDGRATLIGGILGDALVGLFLQFGSDLEGREIDRAGGFGRENILLQDRWFREVAFYEFPVVPAWLWMIFEKVPQGVAFDESCVWNVDFNGSIETNIFQALAVDGARVGDFNFRTHLEKIS